MRMFDHDDLVVSDQEKIQKDQILLSHILHCMDSGWCFVYEKPAAAQVFNDARFLISDSTTIHDIDDRIAARVAILKSLVDAAWSYVNIPFASRAVGFEFEEAKKCVDAFEMKNPVAHDLRAPY